MPTAVEYVGGLFALRGSVVVIAGASSGLGRDWALCVAQAGATVIACARRVEKLNDLAADAVRVGCEGRIVPCGSDITTQAGRDAIVAAAEKCGGVVDVLVNNAGAMEMITPAEHVKSGDFSSIFNLMVLAPLQVSQALFPHLCRSRHPRVINIASVYSMVAASYVGQTAYVTCKHALVGLTRQLAKDWGQYRITVNAIAPGLFPSEITGALFNTKSVFDSLNNNTLLKRSGESGELNSALLYLCSPMSDFVTGSIVVVDGGLLAAAPPVEIPDAWVTQHARL